MKKHRTAAMGCSESSQETQYRRLERMPIFRTQVVLLLVAILLAACTPSSTAAITQTSPAPTAAQLPSPTVLAPTEARLPSSTVPSPSVVPQTTPQSTATLLPAPPTETPPERSDSMEIRIIVKGQEMTATLNNSQAAQDFIAQLPLTVTLEDYSGTEKIYYLPERLSTQGSPAGSDPSIGDITYYAPWGNLAIFYRDFGYSNGLVILGKIDGGMEAFSVSGPVDVTIERMD